MSEHIQSPSGGRQPPERALGGLTPPAQREEHNALRASSMRAKRSISGSLSRSASAWPLSPPSSYFTVAGLLGGLEKYHTVPPGRVSELMSEDAAQPLNERVETMCRRRISKASNDRAACSKSAPKTARESGFAHPSMSASASEEPKARTVRAAEGQIVTVSYYMPGGAGGGLGVVTSVTSPPLKSERKKPSSELPEVSQTTQR